MRILAENIRKVDEFESKIPTAGKLLVLEVSNFTCMHLFIGPGKLFRVTVSPNHPLKYKRLKEITHKIHKKEHGT